MFSGIKSFFGNITLKTIGDVIHIEGVRTDFIEKDLKHYFGSTRVSNNMFTFRSHSFSFHSFFLPDVLFTIDRLTQRKSYKVSVNTLTKIKNLLLTETWLSYLNEEPVKKLNRDKLNDFKLTPLDFQEEFFDMYENNTFWYNLRGYLFAAAAGAGKSFSAAALMEMLEVDKVIIVSPKNALHKAWEATLLNHFKKTPSYWISDTDVPFTGKEKYIIVHYEYLPKLLSQLSILDYNDIGVVLDESHNLNEISSARTNNFIELCEKVNTNNVLYLSGTAIKATSMEAIPLIRCIDPLFTIEVEKQFKAIYRGDNTKATEILQNRLGIFSFKVAKDRLKLEPPIFKQISVSFKESDKYTLDQIKEQMAKFIKERQGYYAESRKEDLQMYDYCLELYSKTIKDKNEIKEFNLYKQYVEIIIKTGARDVPDEMVYCNRFENKRIIPTLPNDLKVKFKEVKTIKKYLHLKIQGECLGRVVSRARINCHVDMVKHIDFVSICESTEKKTVVFSSFAEVVEESERVLKEKELNPLLVYGKTNANLNSIITRFEKEQAINPLVATYASLSTAVPLVMADTMILIDTPFRDYVLQQSVSRIHRLGSDTQTYVYTCLLDTGNKPNISTRTVDILKWSQQQTEGILGIVSPFELKDDLENINMSLEHFNEQIKQYNISIEGLDVEVPETIKPNFLSW